MTVPGSYSSPPIPPDDGDAHGPLSGSPSSAHPPIPAIPPPPSGIGSDLTGRVSLPGQREKIDVLFSIIASKLEGDARVDWEALGADSDFASLSANELFDLTQRILSDPIVVRVPENFSSLVSVLFDHPSLIEVSRAQFISLHSKAAASFVKGDRPYLRDFLHACWQTPLFWIEPLGSPIYNQYFKEETGYVTYLKEFISFNSTFPYFESEFVKLLQNETAKQLTINDYLILLIETSTFPALHTTLSTQIVLMCEGDQKALENVCFLAMITYDEALLDAAFPTSHLKDKNSIFNFAQTLRKKIHAISGTLPEPIIKILKAKFMEVITKFQDSPHELLHLLYLQTFSSANRFGGEFVKELEGGEGIMNYFYQMRCIQEFALSLPSSDPKLAEMSHVASLLEPAFLGFLHDTPVGDDLKSTVERRRDFAKAKIRDMNSEDTCAFPIFIDDQHKAAHGMILEVSKQPDGNFKIILYNSGAGIAHHTVLRGKHIDLDRFYPYEKHNIPLSDLEGLIDRIATVCIETKSTSTTIFKGLDKIYLSLETIKGIRGDPEVLHLRPYKPQTIGNCAFKALSIWIHSHLSDETYRAFKAFSQHRLLTKLHLAIDEKKTSLESIADGTASDEDAVKELFPEILPPSKVLEMMAIGERETLYTESKREPIGSLPLETALRVLQRNPHEMHLLPEFLARSDLVSLTKDQLVTAFLLLYSREHLDKLESFKDCPHFAEALEVLTMKVKKEMETLPPSAFDDPKIFLYYFKKAIYIDATLLEPLLANLPKHKADLLLMAQISSECSKAGRKDLTRRILASLKL